MPMNTLNRNIGRTLVLMGAVGMLWTLGECPSFAEVPSAPPAQAVIPPQTSAIVSNLPELPGSTLHVLTGRSMFVNTVSRLRRVFVSNPAVIDSFTVSPYQIVITAKSSGVSSLILWDDAGKSQMYLVSSDMDVDGLQKSIDLALPNDHIKVEARQDHLALSGTVSSDASVDAAVKLAGLFSKEVANSLLVNPSHTKQVKLKVQIVEIDRSKIDAFGINLFSGGKELGITGTGQFNSVSPASGSSGGGASVAISDPLNLLLFDQGLNVGLTLKDLQNKQILQILAEPTITTLSGQKASFLSGGEFPFPVIQGGSGSVTSVTIQFRPYGVKLEFTPQVNADGTIQLKVAPEVSALDFTNAVVISGYTIPALSTRRADTQVELRDGQSFAISGLLDHRTTDQLSKVPGIADVPILGQFFKSKNINHSVVELVVIVTPSVVDPLTDMTTPAIPNLPLPNLDPASFDQRFHPTKNVPQSEAQPK
jgi:pilus assembly protein CpaC